MKKMAFVVALAASIPSVAHAADIGAFTVGTPMPEALAQVFAATGLDGNVYLFGGYASAGVAADARLYDPIADTYTALTSMPTATRGACGATLPDGRIAVFGGYDSNQLDTLQIYDPVGDSWAAGPAVLQSHGWECAAVVGDDQKLHVFGGEGGPTHYSIFDPVAATWANGTTMPASRLEHGAASMGGKFYVFGGSSSLTTLDIYDPVATTWSAGATLPDAGNTQFAFTSDGINAFVIGGSTEYGNDGSPIFGSVWVYDTTTSAWAVNPVTLATAVRESYAVIAAGELHVFGGSTGTRTDLHQISSLDTDGDGVTNDVDNCPEDANPSQEDADSDGTGDVCDVCPEDAEDDIDADGICGDVDNCPDNGNPGQEDADNDGIGDACDDPGAGGGGVGGMASGGMGGDPSMGGQPSTGGDPGVGGNTSGAGANPAGDDDGDTIIDSGCGCRAVGQRESSSSAAWLALLGAAVIGLRRRR